MSKFSYFLSRNKGKVIGWCSFILVVTATCFAIYFLNIMTTKADSVNSYKYSSKNDNNAKIIGLDDNKEEKKEAENNDNSSSKIKVDIKGSVKHEGVYELDSNKRVVDAIELAGGATSKADLSVTNLSKKLKDEMVIIIYSKEELKYFVKVKEEENLKNTECITKTPVNNACIESDVNVSNEKSNKISINNATLEELLTLNGIGETKAKAIIEYREKNGAFSSLEDLTKVDGIGQALFDKIKENITL